MFPERPPPESMRSAEIIKLCHQRAINILEENKDKLHELTKVLLEKETLSGSEFMEML